MSCLHEVTGNIHIYFEVDQSQFKEGGGRAISIRFVATMGNFFKANCSPSGKKNGDLNAGGLNADGQISLSSNK